MCSATERKITKDKESKRMSNYNFKEQKEEYSAKHGKKIPVWITPNYEVAKAKAIEIIESKKYSVTEADFWILMNTTKTDKMAYTGLIISHNGCLKINDNLDKKFNPECVSLDKDGYGGSLVYTYCNAEQGIFEVGEVSKGNCKNDYPYAMAFKRLFDRVVLKLSKLAYNGIYSDSESEEFSQQLEPKEDENNKSKTMDKLAKVYIDTLKQMAKKKGVTVEQINKKYSLSKIEDINMAQYTECVKGLNTMSDAE